MPKSLWTRRFSLNSNSTIPGSWLPSLHIATWPRKPIRLLSNVNVILPLHRAGSLVVNIVHVCTVGGLDVVCIVKSFPIGSRQWSTTTSPRFSSIVAVQTSPHEFLSKRCKSSEASVERHPDIRIARQTQATANPQSARARVGVGAARKVPGPRTCLIHVRSLAPPGWSASNADRQPSRLPTSKGHPVAGPLSPHDAGTPQRLLDDCCARVCKRCRFAGCLPLRTRCLVVRIDLGRGRRLFPEAALSPKRRWRNQSASPRRNRKPARLVGRLPRPLPSPIPPVAVDDAQHGNRLVLAAEDRAPRSDTVSQEQGTAMHVVKARMSSLASSSSSWCNAARIASLAARGIAAGAWAAWAGSTRTFKDRPQGRPTSRTGRPRIGAARRRTARGPPRP